MQKKPLAEIANQYIGTTAGVVLFLFSVAALLGWQFQQPPFVQWEQTYSVMRYDSALAFTLASIALLAGLWRQFYLTRITAVLLFVMSILMLVQTFLEVDWQLTQHLLSLAILQHIAPGRVKPMPLAVGVGFLFVSLALWSITWEKIKKKHAIIFNAWVGMLLPGLGILSLFGYVIPSAVVHNIKWSIMSLSTNSALGFILLGIGVTCLAAYRSYDRGVSFKKSLPILITVFVSLISLLFWRSLITQQQLAELPPDFALITITKELSIAVLIGIAVYFIQKSYYLAIKAAQLRVLTRAALEASPDGLLVMDKNNKVVMSNKKLFEMWQIPESMRYETDPQKVIVFAASMLKNSDEFLTAMARVLSDQKSSLVMEMHFKDGRYIEFNAYPEYLAGDIIGRVYGYHDITNRKRAESELIYQSTHDGLTGLANRFLLLGEIQQEITQIDNQHEYFMALLFIDLDQFKPVNDSLGHTVGDVLLKAVAERLQDNTREEDTLARLGGDEFVVLVSKIKEEDTLVEMINRFINIFSKPFFIAGHELFMKCSLGVSLYPRDAQNAAMLLKNADMAMYAAKKSGLPFRFYSPQIEEQVTSHLTVATQLHHALERKEFVLFYQPIIDLHSGKIPFLECLIRWRHPIRGMIQPNDFIKIAEDIGAIVDIGYWTLQTVCQQIHNWRAMQVLDTGICVNVSAKQLKEENFYKRVADILQKQDLSGDHLDIELTEGALIEHEPALTQLAQLKDLGVNLSIDDFGTEYATFSYLQHFPINRIKIDQSFIEGVPGNSKNADIVRAIIVMAKTLKLRVLAEGVETQEQLDFLQQYGCDEVQGYYFSPPLEAADLERSVVQLKAKIQEILAR